MPTLVKTQYAQYVAINIFFSKSIPLDGGWPVMAICAWFHLDMINVWQNMGKMIFAKFNQYYRLKKLLNEDGY